MESTSNEKNSFNSLNCRALLSSSEPTTLVTDVEGQFVGSSVYWLDNNLEGSVSNGSLSIGEGGIVGQGIN